MATRDDIEAWASEAGHWAGLMERIAANCDWLLGGLDPPLQPGPTRDRVQDRQAEAARLAGEFRVEQAAWERLLVERPELGRGMAKRMTQAVQRARG